MIVTSAVAGSAHVAAPALSRRPRQNIASGMTPATIIGIQAIGSTLVRFAPCDDDCRAYSASIAVTASSSACSGVFSPDTTAPIVNCSC
jgi:hypothetical protein